ncbi:tRNA:Cm32/Um32 methyltransferase [Moraxella catarrhalis]|nr:tRNA:Cm32/Um32 methyltransferase [Moraxella catarrhalis]
MMNDLLKSWLSRIRIVMVGTTLPANIGSAARALHTMGLDDLVVVNPRLPIDDSSYANAAGAGILLDKACITKDIKHAIGDCTLIFAASARSRQMPRPVLTPSMAAQVALKQLSQTVSKNNLATSLDHMNQSADDLVDTLPKIAILFGREDRGLTNEELSLADYHIQIPANPDYPVLNVASAIQVITAPFLINLPVRLHHLLLLVPSKCKACSKRNARCPYTYAATGMSLQSLKHSQPVLSVPSSH